MPTSKRKVRVKWRDPKSIKSHWGPFSFDTTTGISRHAFPEFWPRIRAVQHDSNLSRMFEIIDDAPPPPPAVRQQFAPGQAPWDVPIDVVRARAANRDTGTTIPIDYDPARDAARLAAEEHKAALGRAPRPKAPEPAFEAGQPFDGEPVPETPPKASSKVPETKPTEKPAPPFAEKMRVAREAKARR